MSSDSTGDYDYIVHDVFTGGAEPAALFTLEFLGGLEKLLAANGVIAVVSSSCSTCSTTINISLSFPLANAVHLLNSYYRHRTTPVTLRCRPQEWFSTPSSPSSLTAAYSATTHQTHLRQRANSSIWFFSARNEETPLCSVLLYQRTT